MKATSFVCTFHQSVKDKYNSKKFFTSILTATCIYNHINGKNLYDGPQNRPFIPIKKTLHI